MVAPIDPDISLSVETLAALRHIEGSDLHKPVTRRSGILASKAQGFGADLREIRAYVPGDDVRHIDPAATARTGRVHVRSFHEDRDDATLLLVDLRPMMFWGTHGALRSVRGAKLLTVAAWHAILRGGAIGAVILSRDLNIFPIAGGEAHMLAFIKLLVQQHQAKPPTDLRADLMTEAVDRLTRMAPPGAAIHIATAPDGIPGQNTLTPLTKKCDVTLHLILDQLELAPPAQTFTVSDGTHSMRGQLRAYDPAPLIAQLVKSGATVKKVLPDDP